jgi:hypothetical protein
MQYERPTKAKSPAATELSANEKHPETAQSIAPDDAQCNGHTDAQAKVYATIAARLAIAGHQVFELADGGYLVARWGMTRACPSLQALQSFARMVGAA